MTKFKNGWEFSIWEAAIEVAHKDISLNEKHWPTDAYVINHRKISMRLKNGAKLFGVHQDVPFNEKPTDEDVINQKRRQRGAMLWRERCYKSGKRHNANSIERMCTKLLLQLLKWKTLLHSWTWSSLFWFMTSPFVGQCKLFIERNILMRSKLLFPPLN